jgi:peptidoglycan lytic transglycosylase G
VGAGGEFDVGPSANLSDMTVGRDPGTDERSLDGVPPPDSFSFDDPEAQAREERRLERERRRHEREQRRLGARKPAGDGQPAAEQSAAVRPTRVQRARAGMAAARRRLPPRPPSTAIRRRRVAAVVVLAVAALALWFVLALFQPFGGDGEGKVVVTIPKGATATEVGDILERKGVISDGPPLVSGSTLFRLRLSMAGKTDQIPEGSYTLASGMSYGAAIDELTASPAERGTTVVVPEGYTRDQIAKIASDAGLKGKYKQATVSSKRIDLKRYGAGGAKSLEGFLFPASYELDPRSSVDDLVAQQLKEFKQNFDKVDVKYAESKNLTPYDVLTIASMIDREVQVPSERRLVAEVIYNRLEAGEPLGIDATIRYATGNWRDPLTKSELAIDSPYNSRLVAGLPPTPIGNPGLDSIRAAADPGRGDNRWFVVKPGTCGEHVFSDTEQEFNQAAARYQRALEREGGSPTEC